MNTLFLAHIAGWHIHAHEVVALVTVALVSIILYVALEVTAKK